MTRVRINQNFFQGAKYHAKLYATDGADNIEYRSIRRRTMQYGLDGNDTIYAHCAGTNYVDGGSGNDTIYFQGSQVSGGVIFGGTGNDYISALSTLGYGTGDTFRVPQAPTTCTAALETTPLSELVGMTLSS